MPIEALKRSHTVTSFEPFTLLSALAGVTSRIGLVATASTTFDEPYHVARRFASLDHISGGRAGWNIVTTANPSAALNSGLTEHVEHDERYRRAREFYDVVTGLWDSFAADAFVRDVDAGAYGEESEIRADLVPVARRNAAARYGADFSGEATVLVGDTPLDIEAALAAGARAVGVATGSFSLADLQAAGAHAALPDLTDLPAAVAAILP